MLDWKNRTGKAEARERVDARGAGTRSYFGGLLFSRALATLIGIYLLVTIAVFIASTGAGLWLCSGVWRGRRAL